MDFEDLKIQIEKVNKIFYDGVYKDPWLGQIFQAVSQEHIERQQTDFMLGAFGGPKRYSGRSPTDAHPHIFVNEEMWQLREKYLNDAFNATAFPQDLQIKWKKIDEAFKSAIIKASPRDCKGRYTLDEIINIPNPSSHPFKKVA